jgi:hypothetical protein
MHLSSPVSAYVPCIFRPLFLYIKYMLSAQFNYAALTFCNFLQSPVISPFTGLSRNYATLKMLVGKKVLITDCPWL